MSRQSNWLATGVVLGAVLLAAFFLYQQTVSYMVELWNDLSDGEYAHGYLVLAISAYLIFTNRRKLSNIAPCDSRLVLPFVLAASMLWLVAILIDIEVVQSVALLGLVFSLVWALCGHRAMLVLAFPILYIGFAVPIWFPLSPLLQDITADIVFWITRAIEVPAFRKENMIIVPAGVLSIEEACSGLRYFLAALTLGSLYAYMNYVSLAARIAVVAVVAGAAVLANVVRVFIVVYLGYKTDMQHPWVADHLMLGWYIFAALITILLLLDSRFYRHGEPCGDSAELAMVPCDKNVAHLGLTTLLCIVFMASGPMLYHLHVSSQQASIDELKLNLPVASEPWFGPVASSNDWQPKYNGAVSSKQDYRRLAPSSEVSLYIAYYPHQKQGAELINVLNKISRPRRWKPVYTRAHDRQLQDLPLLEQQVENKQQRRLIWYWYNIGGQVTTNKYEAKLLQLRSLLTHETDAFVVAVSVPMTDDVRAAREILKDFINTMGPELGAVDVSRETTVRN